MYVYTLVKQWQQKSTILIQLCNKYNNVVYSVILYCYFFCLMKSKSSSQYLQKGYTLSKVACVK